MSVLQMAFVDRRTLDLNGDCRFVLIVQIIRLKDIVSISSNQRTEQRT